MMNERTAFEIVKPMCPNSARSNSSTPLRAIRVARGVHLLQHERMAANRALAEDDQAAREDVRAFDRDRDRNRLIAASHVILRGPRQMPLPPWMSMPSFATTRLISVT